MAEHFTIDMLPGREGDCLWVEYGDGSKTHRIIIDGGRQIAYDTLSSRFAALPDDQRELELLVCTHVDADHIEGLLKLVYDPDLRVSFKDVWFNGFDHLKRPDGSESFGAKQGERFTDGIIDRRWPWNDAFGGASVVISDEGDLPVKSLAVGMKLTLFSPTWNGLEKLRPIWRKECEKAGLIPGVDPEEILAPGVERFGGLNIDAVKTLADTPFKKDRSEANGSSIAFLAEFAGKSILLAGDAHADVIGSSLERFVSDGRMSLDAVKLSHHGSQGTVSSDLLARIDCATFLVSTDGSRHDHPDREAIARVVVSNDDAIEIVGNYASDEMLEWDIPALKAHFKYNIVAPNAAENGTIRTHLI